MNPPRRPTNPVVKAFHLVMLFVVGVGALVIGVWHALSSPFPALRSSRGRDKLRPNRSEKHVPLPLAIGLILTSLGLIWFGTLFRGGATAVAVIVCVALCVGGGVAAIRSESRFKNRLRSRPGCCAHCGYDLSARPFARCPECGRLELWR